MGIQALHTKLLSLGFQEKTYDHSEGVFISLTQTVGNTPFCTPEYVQAQDYGIGSLYYGYLITMELTPEGKFQCAGLGDAHDYFCLTECDQGIVDMVVSYYETHKTLTNMRWCFIVEGQIHTVTRAKSKWHNDGRHESTYSGVVFPDFENYKVKVGFIDEGVFTEDGEYTLFGSLHDLAMVLEA